MRYEIFKFPNRKIVYENVVCFNRDSLYLGSITVNDRCQDSNTNGRMDKRMLVELKPVVPEWYASYEKQCK